MVLALARFERARISAGTGWLIFKGWGIQGMDDFSRVGRPAFSFQGKWTGRTDGQYSTGPEWSLYQEPAKWAGLNGPTWVKSIAMQCMLSAYSTSVVERSTIVLKYICEN